MNINSSTIHDNVLLPVIISNKNDLFQIYMPFIASGGLFIATNKNIKLGDIASLSIKLLDEPEIFMISGKVIWITPTLAQGHRKTGIGIQLDAKAANFRVKIENYLAENLMADSKTETM